MSVALPAVQPPKARVRRVATKALKRVVGFGVAAYLIPWVLLGYVACGLLDVLRNRPRSLTTLDRYFAGNGVLTWLLSPVNLLLDLLCLPHRNRGIYTLADLPAGHREEVQALIDAAHRRDLVGALQAKMGDKKRGMIFFQWYGKVMPASVDVPEFREPYKYIRTIGVSIFNKRQSTGEHFGPLRITLRVLYNINPIHDANVYIRVGDHTHRWRD